MTVIPSPMVVTAQGTLCGSESSRCRKFLNVPFADPPQRWKPPTPPTPWEGVRDATEYGNVCPQPKRLILDGEAPFGPETQPFSEDCLYLNVYTPPSSRLGDNAKLPVMVWIHGGSFTIGSNSTPVYRADSFVEDYDVCVVTVNYRLGVFGFFASEELRDEAKSNGTSYGNYGLLDQIAAVEWVANNIAAFGGDPERITLYGESAGAISVHFLCLYAPHLPIRRAIMQSGTAFTVVPSSPSALAPFLAHVKIVTGSHSLAELRAVPTEDLERIMEEYQATAGLGKAISWRPVFDGDVPGGLVQHATTAGAVTAGLWNPNVESVIIGDADEEGSYFARSFIGQTGPYTPARLEVHFPPALATPLKAVYGPLYADGSEELVKKAAGLYFSELLFHPGSRLAMEGLAAKVKVYGYRFSASVQPARNRGLEACHVVDIPYTFNHKAHLTPSELPLAKGLLSHWTNFAANGTPLSNWEPYSASEGGRRLLQFIDGDVEQKMVDRDAVKNFDAGRIGFWTGLHTAQVQAEKKAK
ncbi:alpha/beta-hydrolase [Gonapodya prolifera JEL478]|uniref:Carboxylic ester hydrolase n=1 Tax=Gonapodya prolifera (strain JEL478) TaxID=1344416 RepID=A0A139AEQ8_GONPJ|nr:alpha/beta-hydrolase [Gonapodya prolifera JEL478]|eukprot:KXS15281.1 alpha/beta-hydrolase [Gonapodya prolifera JEL478]